MAYFAIKESFSPEKKIDKQYENCLSKTTTIIIIIKNNTNVGYQTYARSRFPLTVKTGLLD